MPIIPQDTAFAKFNCFVAEGLVLDAPFKLFINSVPNISADNLAKESQEVQDICNAVHTDKIKKDMYSE